MCPVDPDLSRQIANRRFFLETRVKPLLTKVTLVPGNKKMFSLLRGSFLFSANQNARLRLLFNYRFPQQPQRPEPKPNERLREAAAAAARSDRGQQEL